MAFISSFTASLSPVLLPVSGLVVEAGAEHTSVSEESGELTS